MKASRIAHRPDDGSSGWAITASTEVHTGGTPAPLLLRARVLLFMVAPQIGAILALWTLLRVTAHYREPIQTPRPARPAIRNRDHPQGARRNPRSQRRTAPARGHPRDDQHSGSQTDTARAVRRPPRRDSQPPAWLYPRPDRLGGHVRRRVPPSPRHHQDRARGRATAQPDVGLPLDDRLPSDLHWIPAVPHRPVTHIQSERFDHLRRIHCLVNVGGVAKTEPQPFIGKSCLTPNPRR